MDYTKDLGFSGAPRGLQGLCPSDADVLTLWDGTWDMQVPYS